MKSIILSELKTDRYGKTKTLDLCFENASLTHVKDDYDEIWTDFLEEDLSDALKHAKQELELAVSGKGDKKIHLKKACKDFENYLAAADYLVREEICTPKINYTIEDEEDKYNMWDRDAKKLISNLASFDDMDVDKAVVDIITRAFNDDAYDPRESFMPNYRELYQEIGDSALFYQGDMERAMLWYDLLPLDWEGLKNEVDEELEKEDLHIKKENSWWYRFNQNTRQLLGLSQDEMHHTIFRFNQVLDMSKECVEKLQVFLSAWGSYQDGIDDGYDQEIWSRAIEYCMSVKTDMDGEKESTNNLIRKKLRTEVLFAIIIINNAKYYHLITLSKDDRLSNEQIAEVKNILMQGNLCVGKAKPIEEYVRNMIDTDKSISNDVVLKSLYLVRTISLCDRVLFVLNGGIFTGKVAYYTSLKTLKKMLPCAADAADNIGKFAVMHVAYMNDPNEGKILEKWIFDGSTERNRFGRQRADYPYVFIKCFTPRIDDLPMWEMYGDHAKGCCIVVDMTKIMGTENKVFPVYNVCYIRKNSDGSYVIEEQDNQEIHNNGTVIIQQAMDEVREIWQKAPEDIYYQTAMQDVISRVTYLFKNADYSYEREKRIIYSLPSGLDSRIRKTKLEKDGDSPLVYVLSDINVHIDEIILGPKSSNVSWEIPHLQKSLEEMQKEIGDLNKIAISYSDISYR